MELTTHNVGLMMLSNMAGLMPAQTVEWINARPGLRWICVLQPDKLDQETNGRTYWEQFDAISQCYAHRRAAVDEMMCAVAKERRIRPRMYGFIPQSFLASDSADEWMQEERDWHLALVSADIRAQRDTEANYVDYEAEMKDANEKALAKHLEQKEAGSSGDRRPRVCGCQWAEATLGPVTAVHYT